MAQDEFLKLQALNHFSYAVNISRCQPSWAVDYHIPAFKESILTEPEHYFTSPELLRFEKLIIKTSKRKKNFAQVKSNDINVYKSKTFQYGSELFSVEPDKVVKYSNLQSSKTLEKTLIYEIPGEMPYGHAVANI